MTLVAVLLLSFSLHGHSALPRPTATSHNLLEVESGIFASIRGACKANTKWPPKDPASTKTDQVPMPAMCGTWSYNYHVHLKFQTQYFSSDHTHTTRSCFNVLHICTLSLFFLFLSSGYCQNAVYSVANNGDAGIGCSTATDAGMEACQILAKEIKGKTKEIAQFYQNRVEELGPGGGWSLEFCLTMDCCKS